MPCTRRILVLLALLTAALAPAAPAAAQSENAKLTNALAREMRGASSASGAYVVNTESESVLFGWKSTSPRILASNTKLFTNGAALAANGPGATLETDALAVGTIDPVTGLLAGDLYLRGSGDPSFGSSAYNRHNYSGGASVETLADSLYDLGLRHVSGRVIGDESIFDRLRGTAYSNYGGSSAIGGPLTGLAYDHGRASNGYFQTNPPVYAAARFTDALRKRGVRVDQAATSGGTPKSALELADVESAPMARLAQITGVRSENWFSEMLLKGLSTAGTTRQGAAESRSFARSLGAKISVVDGSGLSRANKASPREVVDFLRAELERPEANAFVSSLPTAGESGTLANRMRSGPARGRCRAKTGTINGVTTLSGYCDTAGGDRLAFSILMNNTSAPPGRSRQDRMVQAIARYRG